MKNQQSLEFMLGKLGKILKDQMPEGMGFALFLFEFKANSPLLYISTAQREAVTQALKKFISEQPAGLIK